MIYLISAGLLYAFSVYPGIRSIFAISQWPEHNGHVDFVFCHLCIQSKWNTWLHVPNAILRPKTLALHGLAWYSIDGSVSGTRQIAQVSEQISQLHIVTAFHSIIFGYERDKG